MSLTALRDDISQLGYLGWTDFSVALCDPHRHSQEKIVPLDSGMIVLHISCGVVREQDSLMELIWSS